MYIYIYVSLRVSTQGDRKTRGQEIKPAGNPLERAHFGTYFAGWTWDDFCLRKNLPFFYPKTSSDSPSGPTLIMIRPFPT